MNSEYGTRHRKCISMRSKISLRVPQGLTNPTRPKKKRNSQACSNSKNKCLCVPILTSPIEFPPIWNEFRNNNQLCDGIVSCEDGTEFKVHRAILSAVSPYFKALFTNSINRNQPENKVACVSAPSDIFKRILDFAYTGGCEVDDNSLEALMHFADQYEVLGVVKLCCEFVLANLRPDNCIGILRFSRQYFCKELEMDGRRFVRLNFSKVLKTSREFLLLPLNDLVDILTDDDLNVRSEELVFEGVRKWVEFNKEARTKYICQLIRTIRLGSINVDFINNEILQWPPIADSQVCSGLVRDILKNLESSAHDIDVVSNPMFRPRVPYDVLFAVGGWTAGSPTNFIETYDTRADKWLLSHDNDPIPRAYHGICALKGLIYMIGGFDGNEHFNTVRCFNPETHKWKDCACMYYPRCYVSVVMHDGKIYAMGGYNGRVRMSSAERYDPSTNQWTLIQSMQRQRSDASAASLEDKIYIVGGFNGSEVMNSAEVYDTLTDQWSLIPRMISARSGVSLVAFKDTLYALGGFNGFTRLTSGEKYSPSNSAGWSEIADMFSPRSNFATVILDDYIFVIGGFNDRFVAGSTTINFVECYDAENNEWFDAAPMNLNRSALSACVISGLKNARQYSLLGRSCNEIGQGAGSVSPNTVPPLEGAM